MTSVQLRDSKDSWKLVIANKGLKGQSPVFSLRLQPHSLELDKEIPVPPGRWVIPPGGGIPDLRKQKTYGPIIPQPIEGLGVASSIPVFTGAAFLVAKLYC